MTCNYNSNNLFDININNISLILASSNEIISNITDLS